MRTFVVSLAIAAAGVAGTSALQSTMAQVGVTSAEIEKWATEDIEWNTVNAPSISAAARKMIKGLGPEARAALVREAAGVTKAFLMSPAFQKLYAAKIKASHNAVAHGINPDTYGQPTSMDLGSTIAVPMVMMLRGFTAAQLKTTFDGEREEMAQTVKDETGEERAKAQRYLTKLNGLAPLASSNPEEFKKQYTLAKSAYMGGPDTEAKLQAANSGSQDADRIRQEQRQWNLYNLNGILKTKLAWFIKVASQVDTVDFKAVTRQEKDKMVFVNPAYESKDKGWKAIYRVGRAPTVAALEFAKAWQKELK